MRMLVLGAGAQGTACAFDLLEHTTAEVTIADAEPGTLHPCLRRHDGKRLGVLCLDATNAAASLSALKDHDVALSALPYYLNFRMAGLAIEARTHFADLGGNTEIVRQQESLHDAAVARRVSVVPDCGLAPGMVNVLAAEGIRRVDRAQSVKLFVGGLPQYPEPPLNYQVVYSLEGALDYYTTPSWILRNGTPVEISPLSELEDVDFAEPLGVLEAFHTGGGVSTMPWHFQSTVDSMEYKTLRYPGHAELMRAMRELGLYEKDPIDVHGQQIVPRDVFIAILDPRLRNTDAHDLVALRVVVHGTRDGVSTVTRFDLLDQYDEHNDISAMMRVTGYSLSITGQMLVDGRIAEGGVAPAYVATPFEPYVMELRARGIDIEERAE